MIQESFTKIAVKLMNIQACENRLQIWI